MATMQPWQDSRPPRAWIESAFAAYLVRDAADFLVVATPGAGKTGYALRVAHHLLETRRIDRVVVVVPSEHLRKQWADNGKAVGLELDPTWSNRDGRENADYHGVVVTYHTVASNARVQALNCRQARTLIILAMPTRWRMVSAA
jgi:superfamily II DNA or RNA helicase